MNGNQKRTHSLLEFTLHPTKVVTGSQKLTAKIKNTGDGVLKNMILLLHSLNENLSVEDSEKFIYALMPGQEASVDVRVFVATNAEVFFSLSGFKNGDTFFRLDSPLHQIIIEETMPITEIKAM